MILRTTSNQRSPPSGCAWSGVALAALAHPLAVLVVAGPVLSAGRTCRHWPSTRSSLGSLLPKASLRMLRQTALKYAAAAESASWV